jgi:hypothetical protein
VLLSACWNGVCLGKLIVEVCLVVFLVSLVAQCTVKSPVNVIVKEGNFPLL